MSLRHGLSELIPRRERAELAHMMLRRICAVLGRKDLPSRPLAGMVDGRSEPGTSPGRVRRPCARIAGCRRRHCAGPASAPRCALPMGRSRSRVGLRRGSAGQCRAKPLEVGDTVLIGTASFDRASFSGDCSTPSRKPRHLADGLGFRWNPAPETAIGFGSFRQAA